MSVVTTPRVQELYGGVLYPRPGLDLDNIERLDMGAKPLIHRMMQTGLQVDLSHFEMMHKILIQDMERITEKVRDTTGYYINVGSGDQVADLLFRKLGLKQARPQMTKTGDRESVEHEVLVAIQHDHEVVPHVLEYKEVEKLDGTYVKPMPKLAKRTKFGVWRVYPNLGDSRVPSGRLNCIAKGTLIEVIRDVSKYPKGIPIEDVKAGDLVYTFDDNLNLTIKPVKWAAKTGRTNAVRVHWMGTGKKHTGYVDLTPEHRVRLITGDYVEAQALKSGDSICALSRGVNQWGYSRLYASGIGEIPREHRFIWSQLYGEDSLPEHVHHKDDNGLNNLPSNLQGMTESEHHSHHAKRQVFSESHRANLTLAYYETGLGSKTFEERSKFQEHHKLNISKEWIETELDKYKGKPTEVCKAHGIDYATFQKYMRIHSVSWKEVAKRHKLEANHTVLMVVPLGIECDVYDMEVQDTHNFIAGEICVHNCKEPNLLAMPNRTARGRQLCEGFITDPGWVYLSVDLSQIEPRLAAHLSQDKNLLRIYHNDEDIYSDFATAAFRLKDERWECSGYTNTTLGHTCDNKEHLGHGWHYPTVHKKDQRSPAKICILASIYEVTAKGLLEHMPIICANCLKEATRHDCGKFSSLWTEDKCQELINAFYMTYPGVLADRMRAHKIARRLGYIYDMWGRCLHVAAVRSIHPWVVSAALREVSNFGYQAGAAGVAKIISAQLEDDFIEEKIWGDIANPLLFIHDEWLCEVREDMAQEVGEHIIARCQGSVELSIPLKAGMAIAPCWGKMEK